MCFYCRCERIVEKENGQILRDYSKKNYALQYGNVDIMMKKKQFMSFSNFLNSLTDDHLASMTNKWTHKIILKQKEFMGGYCFERDEFYDFREMINEGIGHVLVEDQLKMI